MEEIDFGSMALLEEQSAPAWYSLPEGWTWRMVAESRFEHDISRRLLPLACAPGVVAWGYPIPTRKGWEGVPEAHTTEAEPKNS